MTDGGLVRIEPEDRLVVLAKTLQMEDPSAPPDLMGGEIDRAGLGDACLGRALYRHRSIYQGASDAPAWSHLELFYFRGIVPVEAVNELVLRRRSQAARLLRAEVLLTTPWSFVMPRGWQGLASQPERQASLEYLDVRPEHLASYRDIMRRYIGPAAAKLVEAQRFGTFRAMETAAVLVQDPSFQVRWNQIHLCEVEAATFKGFGREFDAALRDLSPDGGFEAVFAGLGEMRTIPRWTFNDALLEADSALAA